MASTHAENGPARPLKAYVKSIDPIFFCFPKFDSSCVLIAVFVRREESKKTKATQNLSSEQYSGERNFGDFHLQAGCWSLQPTRGNASTSSDIGDVSEGVDAPSPAKVLKYTNTYVDPVFDTESRGSFDPYELHNMSEKEMSLNRRDLVSPPGPPLIGFVIGQDDQAFRGCLMDDIPSWKRELLLHCE